MLKQIRLNKPSGIYLAEYLSADKRKIYSRLLKLKKEYSSVFKALYTREGEIYGKIGRATLRFRDVKDIENINFGQSEPPVSQFQTPQLTVDEDRLSGTNDDESRPADSEV